MSWLVALLHNQSVAQDDDPVAEPKRLVEIVSDEHDGLLQFRLQVEQHGLHVGSDQRIERRIGLVHEKDRGIVASARAKPDPLLHAAR